MIPLKVLFPALALTLSVGACRTAYYGAMERFGVEKRDILVERVDDVRNEQGETRTEFADALEQFRSVVTIDGGELEEKYDRLNRANNRINAQANDLRGRIKDVDNVAKALFREWENELDDYSDASLRRTSAEQLRVTQARYADLLDSMNRAASRMDPVLEIFDDQVLFLKHNLNARAISSLETERDEIEMRVNRLIREMDAAIAEADAFIATMS
tara:strand:- start:234 stop:878 length:645 start_codon:yes stop_codon:yes gene_type:complete